MKKMKKMKQPMTRHSREVHTPNTEIEKKIAAEVLALYRGKNTPAKSKVN